MSGFQITITNAGRAALINAQNNGTVAFVLSQIGVSTQTIAGDLAGLTALPNERKRLATMAGDVVADDTLHVTIRDESADAYALRSFGLYASTGVLFAVYSQADPILEKSAAAMLLLAVDARLVALGTANVEFGPVGFTLPPASETVAGVVEIATDAEVDAGLDPWRVITARTLKRALGALTKFALKDHKHDAGDIETGTLHANRIPELPMSRIAGLIATLADKASALHSHTMAQVSGLIGALALKANLDSPDITGFPRLPAATLFKKELPNTPEGGQITLEKPDTGTRLAGHVAIDVNGDNVRIYEVAEPYRGLTIPLADMAPGLASYFWTSANFNPDSRVSVAATNLGSTWNVPLTKITSAVQFADLPTGFSSMVTPDSIGTPGGYGYLFKMARRDSDHGWSGLWINHTGGQADTHELYLGSALGGSELPAWTRAWTSANFNPATKANVQYPDFFGQMNLESGPARFRAIGDGDSLFLQAGTATSNNGNLILSGLFGQNLTSLRTQVGGALRDIFHTGNFNPDTKATLGLNAQFRDVIAARNAVDGVYFFGSDTSRWLAYANGRYELIGGGGLTINGYQAWTAQNFNPASKADLNGWTDPSADALATGFKQFVGRGQGTIASGDGAGDRAALEVRGEGGAAFIGFHRPGQFATFFGIDVDNQLKIGGWSLGPNAYRVWTEQNLKFASIGDAVNGAVAPGLHDQVLSPAALWSFAKSIGPNGYAQVPGTDLIIQWGVSAGSHAEGPVHAALPVAFGGGCLFACATPRNANEVIGMDFYMQVVGRYLDRIVFYANRANNSSGNMSGYEWMALGLARGTPNPAYSSGGGGGGGGFPPGGGGGEIIP